MTARRLRRVGIALVVVVVLAVVGDQGFRALAEAHTAKQVRCELKADRTHVTIAGPFLVPQIVRNDYRHIVTVSTGVHSNGVSVDLTSDLHDVHSINAHTVRSGRGHISVTVPMNQLASQAGQGFVASDFRGLLAVTPTVGSDAQYGATVLSRVSLEHDTLVVTPVRVMALGEVIPFATAAKQAAEDGQSLAARRVVLPSLLTDLGLQAPTVTSAGLVLEATAPHFTLRLPDVPGC
jgi:hypothetical protein